MIFEHFYSQIFYSIFWSMDKKSFFKIKLKWKLIFCVNFKRFILPFLLSGYWKNSHNSYWELLILEINDFIREIESAYGRHKTYVTNTRYSIYSSVQINFHKMKSWLNFFRIIQLILHFDPNYFWKRAFFTIKIFVVYFRLRVYDLGWDFLSFIQVEECTWT